MPGQSARLTTSLAAAALAGALLAGCAGGGGTAAPRTSASAQPASHDRGIARFTITIPKASAASTAARRGPRYISPATQSMTLAVTTDPGGTSVINETVALTPTATGCTSTLASTQCSLTITLAPGSYDATIATYDGANATGNELSAGQLVDFTIAQGQTNTVALVLSGIPASLLVSSDATAVHGAQNTGFTLYGGAAQKLLVEALDVDGNVIVGAGAPTFTVAAASGSGYTIANPTTTAPNLVTLTPPGTNGTVETFTLTAAYSDTTCQTSGAVCTANFAVTNDIQTLFVSGPLGVAEFVPPSVTQASMTTSGLSGPAGLAVGAGNTLWVADGNDVDEYAAPYTSAPLATITNGINGAVTLALDATQNVYVVDQGSNALTRYAPPYTGLPTLQLSMPSTQLGTVLLDSSGNLFIQGNLTSAVYVYPPPYAGATTVISGIGEVGDIALDAADDLFVANENINTVTEYTPSYGSSPAATITNGINAPVSIAFDGKSDLFVVNSGTNTVTEYAPPYTGASIATVGIGAQPQQLLIDGAGDLFVSSSSIS
ncbi:MAG: hypothetical protein ABR975_09975, partial [Vulcanimicrobiaceae bacterium]